MTDLNFLLSHAAQQSYPESCLYVVATPIGNLADLSCRALHVLAKVDAVACEDTRNTGQLFNQLGLSKSLIAAHQHNENEVAQKIIQRLQLGESIALVSDAGTPAISDPGARIVDAVRSAGFRIVPVPGASAVITALSASGLLQDQFYFVGFLPSKAGQRDTLLQTLGNITATMAFYEAPHRITETVAALALRFPGDRQLVFARELTKLFEEIHRCRLDEAGHWLAANAHRQKGEYVVLLEGASTDTDADLIEARRVLTILLESCTVKQAAQLAAQLTGQKKNALYQLALDMSESKSEKS
ncbi:16S rRNA (cytidine1402-2'-O)-methyltransferase [Oxalobacteraceae bacterium GrIS 2.11]